MRFVLLAFFLSLISVVPAHAADNLPEPQSGVQRVQLIEDQKLGAVRIVIDGKEVARIDAAGIHAHGDVDYGGMTTDVGHKGFDAYIAEHADGK